MDSVSKGKAKDDRVKVKRDSSFPAFYKEILSSPLLLWFWGFAFLWST